MAQHSFKKGDEVTIFNTKSDGHLVIEGKAIITAPIEEEEERYFVRFANSRDRRDRYERYVDPLGQSDPDSFMFMLNQQIDLARARP